LASLPARWWTAARRSILITANLLRALLLAAIPIAGIAGALSMPLLYLKAFLGGACSLFFEIAYQALMPVLVERRRLFEGNSLLERSRSASDVVGPALGGDCCNFSRRRWPWHSTPARSCPRRH
jgi:hypothetical protein